MAAARSETPPTPADTPFGWMLEYSNALVANMMQVQTAQMQALQTWQSSLATMQKDVWDVWTSHMAGGVPIDG